VASSLSSKQMMSSRVPICAMISRMIRKNPMISKKMIIKLSLPRVKLKSKSSKAATAAKKRKKKKKKRWRT
jgi:hypothetical protein